MGLFEFTGIPLNPTDMQNVVPQYSYDDLRPYTPTADEKARYIQDLRPYRMFPGKPLDERFADFKVRLADALKNRGIS